MRAKSVDLRTMVAVVATLVLASCNATAVTPSPPASPGPPSTSIPPASTPGTPAAPSPSAIASSAPSASATAAVLAGQWGSAGSMATGRGLPHAVPLGDGRVLVIGTDGTGDQADADSARSEIWDAASGSWSAGPSLNKPRYEFVAVGLPGGRVLVTGGLTAGVVDSPDGKEHRQAFSGTYVFDATHASAGWAAVASLAHARTAPAGAALLDGRVLVAGGYYLNGSEGMTGPLAPLLAAARDPACGSPSCAPPPADVAPPVLVPALATAEVYDPNADAWSATGPMHYARVGAPAVTLSSGRVLVVGSALGDSYGANYSNPRISDHAYDTAEVYDPATGRFTLTGDLPAVDWSALTKLGPYPVSSDGVTEVGTPVALRDGGALLVGRVTSWSIGALDLAGTTVQTLRYDPGSGTWTQIDQGIQAGVVADSPSPTAAILAGHSREGSVPVVLADGRVLVAGGVDIAPTATAEIYDPASGAWTTVAPMPGAHRDGVGVLLPDGSALIVGGRAPTADCDTCAALTSTFRYVPGP